MKVVGESHYQDALRVPQKHCVPGAEGRPSFPAALIPEPENPHDRHAVAVHGPTGKLGYLVRDDAGRYASTFEALRRAGYDGGSCTGLLNGGDRDRLSFGVVLMLAYPEVCEKRLGVASGSSRPRARGPASNRHGSGTLRGKHYTEYVEVVKTLRREGHEEAAEQLLLELVEVVEAEATDEGSGVAPWYYEQLREPRAHRISVIMMKKNMKTATRTKSSSRLSYHDRRLARRLKEESVFRAEFQRCSRALRPDP